MIKTFLAILTTFAILVPSIASAQISIAPSNNTREFNFEVEAGLKTAGTLTIKNLSPKETLVEVYPVDASQSQSGTFALTTKSSEQKSIGKWTSIKKPSVTIGAYQKKDVNFTLKIPEKTSPGTYVGGIAAEVKSSVKESGGQVSTSARLVSKVFVKVPGEIKHDYSWTNFSHETNNAEDSFLIGIENTGNSLVTVEPKIEISGFPLAQNQELSQSEIALLQGDQGKLSIPWEKAPNWGILTAKATLTVGQYDFLDRRSVNKTKISKEIKVFLAPWWFILPFLATLILGTSITIWLKIRIIKLRKLSKPYTVKDGETLSKIAAENKIKWKLLAKINRIEAPYSINSGQTILLPPTINEEPS